MSTRCLTLDGVWPKGSYLYCLSLPSDILYVVQHHFTNDVHHTTNAVTVKGAALIRVVTAWSAGQILL